MKYKKEFLDFSSSLLRIGALRFGTFTAKDGSTEPYFIETGIIPSYPSFFKQCISMLIEKLDKEKVRYDALCAIPDEGFPYASALSFELLKPLLYFSSSRKDGKYVHGVFSVGQRVILVDDVSSTGNTLLDATVKARSEGSVVRDAIVLIDKEKGARERLRKDGVKLHCIARISEVARVLYSLGLIEREQYSSFISKP